MKKKIGITLLLISTFLAVYLMCFLGNPVRLEKLSVNEEYFDLILNSRRFDRDFGLLEALFFDEQQLVFDAASDTFYYSIEKGSRSAYNPCVEVKSAYDHIRVKVLDAQITAQDIQEAKVFRLLAYDDMSYHA